MRMDFVVDFIYNALNWVGWATAVVFLVAGGFLAAGAFTEWWDRKPRGAKRADDRNAPRNTKKARANRKAPAEPALSNDGEVSITADTVVSAKSRGKVAN